MTQFTEFDLINYINHLNCDYIFIIIGHIDIEGQAWAVVKYCPLVPRGLGLTQPLCPLVPRGLGFDAASLHCTVQG